jgi:hypothetical protein
MELAGKGRQRLGSLRVCIEEMCRSDEPISIQFSIVRALASNIHAIEDPDLQRMRASILRLLYEKFDVENEK